jgi:glycosyltransferase involved in cell wall biosynthesis
MQNSNLNLDECLIIFTHVLHYRQKNQLLAHGPYVNEINVLAERVREVVLVAPLLEQPKTISPDNIPYTKTPRLIPLPIVGGDNFLDKVSYLWRGSKLGYQIMKGIRTTGVLHPRAPGSVAMIALFLIALFARKKKKFVKFAGEWDAPESLPLTFRLQRHWLANKKLFNGPVFVYSTKSNPSHIIPAFTSNLTIDQIQQANLLAGKKMWGNTWQIIFAGRLVKNKGVDVMLQALALVNKTSTNWRLLLMGDGSERSKLQQKADDLGLAEQVTWLGWCSQQDMMMYMREAHLICQPTRFTESWGKVLQEGMAYGCIPIASAVGGLKRQLQTRPELLFEPGNATECAAIMLNFINQKIDYRQAMEWSLAQSRLYSLNALADFTWNKYHEYYNS